MADNDKNNASEEGIYLSEFGLGRAVTGLEQADSFNKQSIFFDSDHEKQSFLAHNILCNDFPSFSEAFDVTCSKDFKATVSKIKNLRNECISREENFRSLDRQENKDITRLTSNVDEIYRYLKFYKMHSNLKLYIQIERKEDSMLCPFKQFIETKEFIPVESKILYKVGNDFDAVYAREFSNAHILKLIDSSIDIVSNEKYASLHNDAHTKLLKDLKFTLGLEQNHNISYSLQNSEVCSLLSIEKAVNALVKKTKL